MHHYHSLFPRFYIKNREKQEHLVVKGIESPFLEKGSGLKKKKKKKLSQSIPCSEKHFCSIWKPLFNLANSWLLYKDNEIGGTLISALGLKLSPTDKENMRGKPRFFEPGERREEI